MKKIIRITKKYDEIAIFLILTIIVSIFTFSIKLNANDTLWNFSNIYKMTNGYIIYKDLNVIITPLYFFIGKIVLQLFGTNYLVYSIYQNFIIYLLLFFLIYKLFKKLQVRKLNSMLYTIIIAFSTIAIMPDASYNMLAITFIILGIYNILSKKNNLINNILQGIICFLIFITKQNIGIYYIIAIVIAQLLTIKDKKIFIKNILIQIISGILLITLFLIYMNIRGNLNSFINYAFLGISEFSSKNIRYEINNIIFNLMTIILSALLCILTYNKKITIDEKQKVNIRTLSTISLFMIFIAYPLINTAHTLIGNMVFFILFCYILDILIFKELLVGIKIDFIKKIIIFIIIVISLVFSLYNNISYFIKITSNNYYFNKENPYYGAIADEEIVNEINEVSNYIKQQNDRNIEVKIISCYSNLYMNILNKNNGDMDLPFYGNMGKKGEDGMIEKIDNLKNSKILITKEQNDIHMQESEKIIKHIKGNFNKEGEICRFLIYKSK